MSSTAHVALTLAGRYLQLGIGGDRRLESASAELEPRGVFLRDELGHGRIALRTLDGRFLATRPDSHLGYAVYAEEELTPAAAFEEILWPDGRISLRSCHLTYVSARPGGRVSVNRADAGQQERFELRPVAVPAVPAQRRPGRLPVGSGRS